MAGLTLSETRSVSALAIGFFRVSRALVRSAISRKISQSCRASSAFSKTGGVNRAVLRTAKVWKTRSYWSRSSAVVGGRITRACRVVSLR